MTQARDEWLSFIADPKRGGRYLFARGESLYTERADPGHTLPTVLTGLGSMLETNFLVALHFLSSPAVQEFVRADARALARVALHSSVRSRVVSSGGIRGKVNWQRTLVEQQTSALAGARYHLDVPRRTSDLPENRLLKLFLSDLCKLAATCRGAVGSGHLHRDLGQTLDEARLALREPHIRDLPYSNDLTTLMRQRARRNRDRRYHVLADLQEELEQLMRYRRRQATLSLLRRGWFQPIRDDDIFEVYLLLLLLDVLETEIGAGPPTKYGLVRSGRAAVAEFEPKASARIRVFFDQGPSTFVSSNSEYIRVSRAYGLTVAERRPDISLLVEGPHRSAVFFLEAKKTGDDRYERDSVYKALGYLRDFEAVWQKAVVSVPRVAVVYPEMASPASKFVEASERLVLLGAGSRSRMAAVVQAVLDSAM